jgi:uncharacterized protein (DUF362 family)
MGSKVAVVRFEKDVGNSLERALKLIGKPDDINTIKRSVVIKVGVFDPNAENHTTVSVVDAIIKSFNKAPRIFLAESDNYRGKALERLQLWKELFTDRVTPFSLSDDTQTKKLKLAGDEMRLSHILFKPNVLVSTHVLRGYERGSVLKNLFGLVPSPKKAKFHKKLDTLLADIYEAISGADLAVIDGTYLFGGFGAPLHAGEDTPEGRVRMNTLVVGRDAVAVDTVGATLAGLKPEKMTVIQEFVKRGLGEGDIDNIEIVGADFESLKEEFASTAKTQKKRRMRRDKPQTWGGQAHRAMKSLFQEAFFRLPNKKTREDVVKAFEARGVSTKGKENKIEDILARRVKRGILKADKGSDGLVYWTE